MDLRQLSYFLAVAEHGSFSKASKALHLSQPTLSKMIKNLEAEWGIRLFVRSTRSVYLTDTGKELLASAFRVMQSVDQLNIVLAEMKQSTKGMIRLGLPPVIGVSFFPEILSKFRRQYPHIDIQLIEEGGKIVEQSIIEGKLDLGVVVLPVEDKRFEIKPLVKRELKLVLSANHLLANRHKVEMNELKSESFIFFRRGFSLFDQVRDACIREGFEPNIVYESTQWDFMCEMVAAGQGISILPDTICGRINDVRIKVIPVLNPALPWDLALIWSKKQYISKAARTWITFSCNAFKNINLE